MRLIEMWNIHQIRRWRIVSIRRILQNNRMNEILAKVRWNRIIYLPVRWTGSMLQMQQTDEYRELMPKMGHQMEKNSSFAIR